MSYKKLLIWQQVRKISIDLHHLSLGLPKFELYETGSQLRRSSKSIRSNIVEGYGRRRYGNDYIRFLTYASASVDETRDHIETLFETGSLHDIILFEKSIYDVNQMGKMMHGFIKKVESDL
jgi:four helix bundle protein